MKLDLSNYTVPTKKLTGKIVDGQPEQVETEAAVNVKEHIYELLRVPGVCDDGSEICEVVAIARAIRDCEEDSIELKDSDMKLVKKVFNRLIDPKRQEKGAACLGGPEYEELIMRVFEAV